ncbi:hypothetical protein PSU4_41020 [Pseudonocardia sulfidoxydans NBRC 16205]|uniref:HTH cro/C1-type domain-containing protein n=1 Tax=Pseudonocardia sulfidoxydans NBRC 16205 TaxID=1223511 RepID=A0A511DQ08_9PSEU|nr:helix-turn-helix transcriptional regulator [Pseudonocardia sulfidoxydans]GEL25148.1 hypothetical protein PSU4_41020 [Pseudonocardia sulfidoxydans NBRC 16205]
MTVAADPDKIVAVKAEEIGSALRAERAARGWSLSDAAREIGVLAARTGRRVASTGSLRTQLSRWENGRVTADADSLALLAELYETPELRADRQDPAGAPMASPAERLRAALTRAAAVDDATLHLLRAQLAVNAELDATLGAAGAGQAVAAAIEQLDATSVHTVDPRRRRAVAELLAQAALLGGWQALDQDEPDVAFTRHRVALDAARLADAPALTGQALAGCASALLAVGLPAEAEAVLAEAPASGAGAAWVRIAHAEIRMSCGERDDATRLYDDAATFAPAGEAAGDGDRPVPWRPGVVPATAAPPIARRRGAALAPYDDAALEQLRAGVEEPGLPARERARLRTQLVLALVARGVRAEAEEQAGRARALAGTIGSHREQRLLDEVLG